MPDLGSAGKLADAEVASQAMVIESSVAALADQAFVGVAAARLSISLAAVSPAGRKPARAFVTMRSDTGDKLEHEEGAP